MSNPKQSWRVVHALETSIADGKSGLSAIPKLIVRIIDDEMWREFWCEPTLSMVEHDCFERFVTVDLPEGLGMELRTLKNLCRDDTSALEAIDRATKRPHGGNHSKTDNIQDAPAPSGTSRDAALRRLRKDRPDLLQQVVDGVMSANAAMVKAGFRKKLNPDEKAVKAIAKAENLIIVGKALVDRMDTYQRQALVEMISELDR